ncbi:MAG TPA: hypothetical protein VIQ51_11980 [Chryseosolibacter sp.]
MNARIVLENSVDLTLSDKNPAQNPISSNDRKIIFIGTSSTPEEFPACSNEAPLEIPAPKESPEGSAERSHPQDRLQTGKLRTPVLPMRYP